MKIIELEKRLQSGSRVSGIYILAAFIVMSLFLCGCEKEPAETGVALQEVRSYPGSGREELGEMVPGQSIITINLPNMPEDAKKLEMVLIKPGSFTMGSSNERSRHSGNEWPVHNVTITKPFYMGKYEVTQAQWDTLMRKNRSYFRGKPDHPVEKVSWRACQKFIKRLNALGQGVFRLPTEAEWEYACRAGTNTQFSFGDSIENADTCMWWKGNNEPNGTKKVGLKTPNPWGLYDMHGNVSEWCSDRWKRAHQRGSQIDPEGPSSGSTFFFLFTNRVFRGGAYGSNAQNCGSSWRSREQSIDYHYSLGFRLVREYSLNR
jgi:formylglycine-generating enzyme required for sulfatase activity